VKVVINSKHLEAVKRHGPIACSLVTARNLALSLIGRVEALFSYELSSVTRRLFYYYLLLTG
jgi:hypothetical protein